MGKQINIKSYGAVEGAADNQAAFVAALAAAENQPNTEVVVPPGTWNYSATFQVMGTTLRGEPGAVLHALTPGQAVIYLRGANPAVRGFTLTGVASARLTTPASCRIMADGATNFSIDGNVVNNCAGASIRSDSSIGGRISGNTVNNSYADSIHLTDGNDGILVEGNATNNSGDDGIGMVSYEGQPAPNRNLTVRWNVIKNNYGGRGIGIVGGDDILCEFNTVHFTASGAGIYISQEHGANDTYAVHRITIRRNEVYECGNITNDHYALLMSGGLSSPVQNIGVFIQRNVVFSSYHGAVKVGGIANVNVQVERNMVMSPTTIYNLVAGTGFKAYDGGPVGVPG